jgi:hypothetical protein
MSKTISSRQPASSTKRSIGATTRTAARRTGAASGRAFHMPFEDKNIMIMLVGVGIIGLGYFLMSQGDAMGFVSLTLAPIVLCIGYLIVVPYGIMFGAREFKKRNEEARLVIEDQTFSDSL